MRLTALLLLVILAAVAAFVAAPWFAFRSLRDAARTEDVPALAQLIDYRAVRANLAAELSGRAAEPPPPNLLEDPVGAVQEMLKPKAAPPAGFEAVLAPRAIAALADGRPPAEGPLAEGAHEPFPRIAFWNPDRCRIVVADPNDPVRRTEFTFQRRGIYSWKLTRIRYPRPLQPRSAEQSAPAR